MTGLHRGLVAAARREGGFTIIEMMVAAMLLAVALAAVLQSLSTSTEFIADSKTRIAATQTAQRELERIKSLGWESLLMDAAPGTSSDPADPRSGVGRGTAGPTYRPLSSAEAQPLAIGDAPAVGEPDLREVAAAPTTWQSGKAAGLLYRFVTWGDDTACGAACPGTRDFKRITVAATITAPVALGPVVLTTSVVNPADAPASTTTTIPGSPPSGDENGFRTFYLYDTPATFSARQEPTTHQARDSQKFPDLMGEAPPPDPNPDPSTPTIEVPLHRYTTDIAGTYAGGAGIQQTGTCKGGDKKKEHMWVSPPMAEGARLTGAGLASLYSQTTAGAVGDATICVTVFDVPGTLKADGSINGAVYKVGAAASHTGSPWPAEPGLIEFPFRFLAEGATYYTVSAGRRIGVYLTVADTSVQDLAVLYDHPDFRSSIGLELVP